MKNILKIYKVLFRCYPQVRWQMFMRAIVSISIPLLESAIPAMAIAMLIEKDIAKYLLGISIILLIDVTMRSLENVLCTYIYFYILGVRITNYWPEGVKKVLTTDYCNVEPASMQNKIEKGLYGINGDSRGIQSVMSNCFEVIIYAFGFLSYGTIVVMIDWKILLIIVVMSVISFLLHRHAVSYSDKNTKIRDSANRAIGKMTWEARSPEYGKDIRIYHVENWFHDIFINNLKKLYHWHRGTELRWYYPTVSDTVFGVIRDVFMYAILIHQVIIGVTTIAEFTFYVGIVAGFSGWLSQFLFKISAVMKGVLEAKGFYDMLDIKDVFLYDEGEKLDLTAPVSIEFSDVSFSYENEEEILSHVSFFGEKGKKIALVGNNGAGKTTIVKLLCGFYLPTEGEILINGISTKDYDMEQYRRGISAVFQDGFIAPFTIAENIAGAREEIDYKKVQKCLKKAELWEKIEELPDKEKSFITQELSDTGINLSGGERQKLLIARALYQDGRLLILDEPTAALDPIAESQVYEKYNEMTENRTSLFISHRLASTKFCDEILFMENGKLKERGSHEELLKRQGKYAEMFEIQSHYYREEEIN